MTLPSDRPGYARNGLSPAAPERIDELTLETVLVHLDRVGTHFNALLLRVLHLRDSLEYYNREAQDQLIGEIVESLNEAETEAHDAFGNWGSATNLRGWPIGVIFARLYATRAAAAGAALPAPILPLDLDTGETDAC